MVIFNYILTLSFFYAPRIMKLYYEYIRSSQSSLLRARKGRLTENGGGKTSGSIEKRKNGKERIKKVEKETLGSGKAKE